MKRSTDSYRSCKDEQRGRLTENDNNERSVRKPNQIKVIAWFGLLIYALFFYGKGEIIPPGEGEAAMYSIDVGQADSTFFIFPDGRNLLIDSGEEDSGVRVAGVLESLGVGKIDAVILTHPHSDHIGGLIRVLDRFDADILYMPECECDTYIYKRVMRAVENKGIPTEYLSDGDRFYGEDYTAAVLSPGDGEYDDENEYSIVLKIDYGSVSYLLMGDADEKIENELLEKHGDELSCTVLKVAHHGSATSSSEEFLDAASPEIAVISAEDSPAADLPSERTVARLSRRGIKMLMTGKDGNIELLTDGENINIRTSEKRIKNKLLKTVDKHIGM